MAHKVICINRRCGSNGHIIGEMVSNELGIKYYDRNLLSMALQYGGLENDKAFQKAVADEKMANQAFYRLQYGGNEKVEKGKPVEDTIFQLQRDLMREIAEKEDCVLVGRCADFILDTADVNMLSVFVTAPMEYRVEQIMAENHLNKRQAISHIKKTDKRRSSYYYYFTKREWKDAKHYDLLLNSEKLGMENCVKLLCNYYKEIL